MREKLRQLVSGYTARRSPWGTPWWIYAVTFAVANLVRQLAIAWWLDVPDWLGIASFVALVVVVVVGVNAVAALLRRRAAGPPEPSRC